MIEQLTIIYYVTQVVSTYFQTIIIILPQYNTTISISTYDVALINSLLHSN